MTNYKTTLEIIIDSITDLEWAQLVLKRDSRRAFQKTEVNLARKNGAIEFADWILKHTLVNGYDEDGFACWILADGSGKTYTSLELHDAYVRGDFEVDDDIDDWDVTLMDGLEEEGGL